MLGSPPSLATGFVCSEDMRDRDGMYREMRLVDDGKEKFDLVYYSMKGFEPLASMTQIAVGLTCNMATDKRLTNCFGATNFMMTTKKIEVTQMKGNEAGVTTKNMYFYMNIFNKDGKEGAKDEYRFLFSDCKVM